MGRAARRLVNGRFLVPMKEPLIHVGIEFIREKAAGDFVSQGRAVTFAESRCPLSILWKFIFSLTDARLHACV
jgi:hypothetical protein